MKSILGFLSALLMGAIACWIMQRTYPDDHKPGFAVPPRE